MNVRILLSAALTLVTLVMAWASLPVLAAVPPVRIAVVPGGGSGKEQQIVDEIKAPLQNNPQIVLSTVNPDWYVICNVLSKTDPAQLSVTCNGTVTIKTSDGHVIDTVSTEVTKQDFAVSPTTSLNRVLIDKAAREAISTVAQRAVPRILDGVTIEMDCRQKVVDAYRMADQGNVSGAIALLNQISADSPNYRRARRVIKELSARGGGRRPAAAARPKSSLTQAKIQAVEAKQKANAAEQRALELEKSLLNGK